MRTGRALREGAGHPRRAVETRTIGCDIVQDRLDEFLDGESDAALRARIRAHLESCCSCEAAAQSQAALLEGLRRALQPPAPPAELAARIHERLGADDGI